LGIKPLGRKTNGDNDEFAYLPIDSKFPMEDYARLAAASEAGDVDALAAGEKGA